MLFLTPLVTVISARIFLKEALPQTFPVTLVLSLVGLVFIVQPDVIFGSSNSKLEWRPLIELLLAVAAWSASSLLIRKARSTHWLQLDLALTTQSIVIWVPLAILIGKTVIASESESRGRSLDGEDWTYNWDMFLLILALGFLSVIAVICNSIGYSMGEATKVWLQLLRSCLLMLPWSVGNGFTIFSCCFLVESLCTLSMS